MTLNKLLLIAIGFLLFLTQSSCRKEKLKDDNEKLLVGNWQGYIYCNQLSGCNVVADRTSMEISAKGLIRYRGDYSRIVSIKEITDPKNQAPQISHLFEVKLKRKNIFHKNDVMFKYRYFRYVNGYFDAWGNFISLEMVQFAQRTDSNISGDIFFIRR